MTHSCSICGDGASETRRVVLETPEKVDETGPHRLAMDIDVCLFCYREEQEARDAERHPWGALPLSSEDVA